MKNLKLFVFVSLLILVTGIIKSADNPANADIVVALDGSGDFTSLQSAIDAVPSNNDRRTIIYIKRGLYNTEKLIIPADKKDISLIGESRDETIISYHIYDCATGKCPSDDAALWTGENIRTSATLTILGNGFRAENLTIQNTAGPVGQALAITVRADKNMFLNCNILGYQDTIYMWDAGKRTYYENCLVVGRTDYIYGAGIAFFQECEIRSWGGGWITAPSTPQSQAYGYVFNQCDLTYATGSPRPGDDGALVALGRPWHEYPKVTWMNSYFCDKIDPLGWPTTWNMDYAATSPDLKLYEYNNNGPGADMSGRANWLGIRALTVGEVPDYTVQKVMAGSDNWDPTAEPPLVKTYIWSDSATTKAWLLPENWSPKTTPSSGEIAKVDSGFIVNANGGSFTADLAMNSGSVLDITASSTVSYLALSNVHITAAGTDSLAGKISTKDTNTFDVSGNLTVDATIIGVHKFSFVNTGKVSLNGDNASYAGSWNVQKGTLEAAVENSLGSGMVMIDNGASIIISNDKAFHPTSRLEVKTGASLVLNSEILLSEFFIDGAMQGLGVYNSTTNPSLISGSGSITVGRPEVFQFIGGENGNWDNPIHFLPQLLPVAGETVISDREMETTSTVFTANINLTGKGGIRLRGTHTCTGLITMEEGAKLSYATGGSGFTLNAPIKINGDIILQMSSGNASGSAMRLPGAIQGNAIITTSNNRNMECTATVVLSGDNSAFNGIWNITMPSAFATSVTAIEGAGENAFGFGSIEVGDLNKAILNHKKCAGDTLILNVTGTGKAVLNVEVRVDKFILNSIVQDTGAYNMNTHPDIFEGPGELIVGRPEVIDPSIATNNLSLEKPVLVYNKTIEITGVNSVVSIYSINGVRLVANKKEKYISLENFDSGIYIVQYSVDGIMGTLKIFL